MDIYDGGGAEMIKNISQEKLFGVEMWLIKMMVIPVVMAIGFFVSLSLVILPKISEINGYRLQIAKNKDLTKQIRAKTAYLISIDQEEVKNNVEQLSMALLRNRDAYFLINVIRDVAGAHDFRVESFSISPGQLGEQPTEAPKKASGGMGLEEIPVKVLLVGPEDKYVNLIAAIERALPVMTVDKVQTRVKSGATELDMDISTNFSPNPADFKISSLTLVDLTLKEEEMELIKELENYHKISGVSADENGLMKKGEYVNYGRREPFGM